MKEQFFEIASGLCEALRRDETLLCRLSGERSDFARFNHARVRQAGSVEQRLFSIRLIRARRQASASLALTGRADDLETAHAALAGLRETLAQLPEDPWLLIAEEPRSTSTGRRGRLPAPEEVVSAVTTSAHGLDLVGFYAAGTIYRGFANSFGQRNWHEVDSFNCDWSLYLHADKAVKQSYAGFAWDTSAFESLLQDGARRLELLGRPSRTLEPGEYRAYLAPRALEEVTGLLSWSGFSARARATRTSPLLRMEHGETLSRMVSLAENTRESIAPPFQQDGFAKPDKVDLIARGELADALVSPRSAREYGLAANAANGRETPEALDMAPGSLRAADALAALETGLYIGNLWYLNFSDRAAGRITGTTRFASFWVEGGRIAAPVNAMRFDDTIYRMLGDNLADLTADRELLLDGSTYEERSTASAHLPGALLRSLRFTL
ncbi:MAG: TldE/PmbA family protein [Betaproteobacteria bacterium]|nr:TldE/PmbA family protein [Betaproteobacteria bacterium]